MQVPNRKVGTSAFAGALSLVLMFILTRLGVEIDAEVASAMTFVLMTIVGYVVPLPVDEPAEDADADTYGDHALK